MQQLQSKISTTLKMVSAVDFRGKVGKKARGLKNVEKGDGGGLEEAAEDDGVADENQGSDQPEEPPSSNQDNVEARQAAENLVAACEAREKQLLSDMELMKEKFAKLLLGEDMSGGGKGVSSALALSNAITNLAASVFGEQSRLEPMTAERRSRWRKEIDWLLSVSDHIVELVPSQQKNKDGSNMEIMVTKQRGDLLMNIPALRTLDAMLLECLDSFKDQNEFSYLSKDATNEEKGNCRRVDGKWWLPTVKVPENGLSDAARKNLQSQKESVTQVLKAAMSINAQVLSEMEIPENYIDSLPKNGRASLGDSIYKSITVEFFDPNQFLSTMDLSSELKILDLKNRIEASIVIWKRKMVQKDGKSAWSSAVSYEKRELFEERAETILRIIKHQYPGIPQSSLDISKIQYNRDVGQALLESYSRILESLAFTVLSRIGDVLYADSIVRNPNQTSSKGLPNSTNSGSGNDGKNGNLMTLSDLLTWSAEQLEIDSESNGELSKEIDEKQMQQLNAVTSRKSYLDNLGGVESPKERH
ncbi:MATERNAL EFFECT EMBRYO ARREST 64, ROP (rho of plants) guanine nucleotide exchange factor 12 [Hibiscus trionum]|uniref:MATERNAL EFFECT EMBRYO ARREST 64, ROP (Rho of plants) guanine nucleotide exchange factor 12 n=1 Tax=Hibiscus trionum TaxID=183268 RepID=A0A9W7HIH0_HIBTR|nr:MATERNAL EFFECT EMBRYO ARREST 64, ROP (rho of plants) guanine nucleotide exchange factor 12 [Hibiscus trionum]